MADSQDDSTVSTFDAVSRRNFRRHKHQSLFHDIRATLIRLNTRGEGKEIKYMEQKGVRKINIISIALRDGHLTAEGQRRSRHCPLVPAKQRNRCANDVFMCETPKKGSNEETFGRKLHQADLQPVIERTFHLTPHIWAFHSQVFPHGWP